MRYDYKASCDRQHTLPSPKPGASVWPRQSCPAFAPRKAHLPTDGSQCWFCRYADFHLKSAVALEVGICCWPDVQLR